MDTQESELIIWNKMLEGDSSALKYFYMNYASDLFAYGSLFTSDRELVKDCVQEVFAKIFQRDRNLSSHKNIKYYLLLSLKNQLYMEFRKRKFSSDIEIESLEFTLSDKGAIDMQMEEQEEEQKRNKKIQDLLNSLPPRQKEIIYYRYIQELSLKEICEIMNLQYQSAQNLIYKAIMKMRDIGLIVYLLILTKFYKEILLQESIK